MSNEIKIDSNKSDGDLVPVDDTGMFFTAADTAIVTSFTTTIDFGPKLEPLWAMAGSFELVLRCNELLERLEKHEEILTRMMMR